MFRYLPEQASEFAPNVDWIHNLVTDISVFFTVAIVGVMIYFAVKYRQRDGVDHETPRIEGSHLLELIWTVVPTVICIFVAGYGYAYYNEIRHVPPGAMTVNIIGQKWKWDFQYPNGKMATGELVVPVDEPVKLVMTSRDVLHSFFVPAMRIKTDLVPGQYTYQWFKPIKTGEYQAFCTEYCGLNHSAMLAKVKVVSKAEYDRWVNDRSEEEKLKKMNPADLGRQLYVSKGCNACHSLDGNRGVGPSFLKVFGKQEKLTDGTTVTVDENYIKHSIEEPNAQIVDTYVPAMPSFAGQLNPQQIDSLIAFIKTIDGTQKEMPKVVVAPKAEDTAALAKMSPVERGKKWYAEKICVTCHTIDGTKLVGPSLKGIYGHEQKLTDGTSVEVNDEYIKNSILKPASQIAEGFTPMMPPYEGQLSDEQIKDITEFIKSLK